MQQPFFVQPCVRYASDLNTQTAGQKSDKVFNGGEEQIQGQPQVQPEAFEASIVQE